MSVAILALMGAVIAALVPGAVALFKVQTVDRTSATVDQARALSEQIKGLWEENRLLRADSKAELAAVRADYEAELAVTRAEYEACRARTADLQIEMERLKWRLDNGK